MTGSGMEGPTFGHAGFTEGQLWVWGCRVPTALGTKGPLAAGTRQEHTAVLSCQKQCWQAGLWSRRISEEKPCKTRVGLCTACMLSAQREQTRKAGQGPEEQKGAGLHISPRGSGSARARPHLQAPLLTRWCLESQEPTD